MEATLVKLVLETNSRTAETSTE